MDDQLHGMGTLKFPNGSSFQGNFVRNNPNGQGRLTTKNLEAVDGNWQFNGRSVNNGSPVGKYYFAGTLIDLKTGSQQPLSGPLALYLLSGLVSLPNMADPMEALLPYAIVTNGTATVVKEDEKGGTPVAMPVADVVQNAVSSSDALKFGQPEAAFRKYDVNDHASVDVLDPRAWLNGVGISAFGAPANTNAKAQAEIRQRQAQESNTNPQPVRQYVDQNGRVAFG